MTSLVIIGQGYVGLPLAQGAVQAGHSVIGLDASASTVQELNGGVSHVDDISNSDVQAMLARGYRATTDPASIRGADVIVICVPTPLSDGGGPDLTAVRSAATDIADHLTKGTLVVLESTTYPGTTQNVLLPILETTGLTHGEDFFLAFSPERIDPGNAEYGLRNTPKVVGGVTPMATERAVDFYTTFVDTVVPVKSSREAEMAKLLENTYRHVNIALVNEMARFCHELDIDLWDVIRAASTKPFGFQAFYPGPGVGGHCIPIDPNYLSYEVQRTLGYPFRFVELAEEINNSMPRYVVERVQDALNDVGMPLRGANVLLLGVTYKANIADQRESPAVGVASILASKGVELTFHDPRVEAWNLDGATLARVADLNVAVAAADLVLLLQNHREYDVDDIADRAHLLFDTRGTTTSTRAIRL